MPVPVETFRNTRTVSIVFALSSLALLASLAWMIKVDYARPWRGYQDHYTELQASLAHFDVLSFQTHDSLEQLAAAQGAVTTAKDRLETQQQQTREILTALSGDDAAVWMTVARPLAEMLSGPLGPSLEKRARGIDAAFAASVSEQAAGSDEAALLLLVAGDPEFRARLVRLLEWFDLQKLHEKADAIRGDYARADLEFKSVKGDVSVALAAYEHEKSLAGEEAHKTREAKAHLDAIRKRFDTARLRVDTLADQDKAIKNQRKLLEADVIAAERNLARIEKDRNDAAAKYADYASTLKRGLFNLPMLDFAAPKGTRGRQEIKQAVLPDVQVELNFVRGYQTDRCMTCHVAIADKSFAPDALARRLEMAVMAINEELEREGRIEQQLTPPVVESRPDLQPGGVAQAWWTLQKPEQKALLAALSAEVNKYQRMRGLPELKFEEPLFAHPELDLYVAPDSPHSMSRMGCTVCHDGNGEETDFVLAAHTPADKKQRQEWKDKYYIRTAGIVPEQDFETAEHHWTRPMLVPRYSEAGCVKCHAEIADIAMFEGRPAASRINEGRFLFTSLGCINCHLVEDLAASRKVGPDLSHLGEKLTREFTENWVLFPHDYRPSTTMPHYFLQENNDQHSETGGGDNDPVLRSRTEVTAITEYLFAASNEYTRASPAEDLWEKVKEEDGDGAKAAAERGRRLFGSTGCLACHANLSFQPTNEEGAAGDSLGQRWISGDIQGKLYGLALWAQKSKAQRIKARLVADAKKDGQDPTEVELDEGVKERLAIDLEAGGKGIPLPALQEAMKSAFGHSGYEAARAHRLLDAPGGVLPQEPRSLYTSVALSEDETALAEVSDEVYEAMGAFAAEWFESMSYVDRVEYAMRHFASGYDTLFRPDRFDPGESLPPVFTRFAPELSSVRTKFADYEQAVTWLYDWLKEPRHYSSYTKMPSLRLNPGTFPVVDAETGEATGETLEADEALDIAVYLASLNANEPFAEKASKRLAEQEGQAPAAYAAKRDELLRQLLGGLNSAARTDAILRDEGGELSEVLVGKLMRSLGEDEARKRIAGMDIEQRRWMYLGDKMIGHYGCYACHQIRGYETAARPGTELTTWGEKQLTQLDFAFFEHEFQEKHKDDPQFQNLYPFDPARPQERESLRRIAGTNPKAEVEHTLASFAWHKLRNPRMWDRGKLKGPYEKLKMPNFFLSDSQADAIVTFLLSRRPARVNTPLRVDYAGTPAGMIAQGRNQARELNCVACHKIDGNQAVMHQYITMLEADKVIFDEVNGPPWLRGQGAKVQNDWFYGFLNNVEMLRPWLKVRMPSFHLENQQGTELVEYFVGLSQHESKWLRHELAPVNRYLADARKSSANRVALAALGAGSAAGQGDSDDEAATADDAAAGDAGDMESGLPPGSDWFQLEGLSRQAKDLRDYSVSNRLVTASAVDPSGNSKEELAAAYVEIVEKTLFLQQLYDVRYPYSASGRYVPSSELAADGEVMFFELKCLACHVFGDPSAKGANAAPSAPNLQLTHARLQSEWVRNWLEAPNRIQPGTKMPNVFGMDGHRSAFEAYTGADREALAAKLKDQTLLDDPVRQREALMAFLYDAGGRRLDKVQPPAEAAGAADEVSDPADSGDSGADKDAGATTQPASRASE